MATASGGRLPMTSPFNLGLTNQVQNRLPVVSQRPVAATQMVSANTTGRKSYNPFLTALNPDSEGFREMYGVNRPFAQPIFLGYHGDTPVYAGSRLCILY
jgi:hypothetical protein